MSPYRNDEKLMQLVANGDRPAQELLLRRVRRRVHVVSTAILKHSEDAEDATQAAVIQILRRAGTYRGASRIETWATRIAAREALRIAQDRRLRAARTLPEDEGEEVAFPPHVELADEIPKHIREYLSHLPETLRNALALRHVLGYSVVEISELLEVSPNTIKDRIARARLELRRMIRRDSLGVERGKVSHS
ncbi:MAG TPA: sigma-70 family RNA polymerase sigma factor [Polyangiaceae bacterium]|nr:sigma-70 family RNA polymerase sigma factor [Polyangiaceae bacterium]